MAEIQIDDATWPIVLVTYPARGLTDESVRAYLAHMQGYLDADARYATITDLSAIEEAITAAQRTLLDAWISTHREELRRCKLGNAIVGDTPLVRGVLTALYWMRRSPVTHTLVPTVEEGRAWCRERLRSVGVALPPAPRGPIDLAPELPHEPGALGPVLDMFAEPAFLVTPDGALVYANLAARRAYPEPPPWLRLAMSTREQGREATFRSIRVGTGADALYLVIPCREAPGAELPPSLDRVAALLSRGFSDKEIAAETGLPMATVRTYVARIFHRLRVHSRAELMWAWNGARAR